MSQNFISHEVTRGTDSMSDVEQNFISAHNVIVITSCQNPAPLDDIKVIKEFQKILPIGNSVGVWEVCEEGGGPVSLFGAVGGIAFIVAIRMSWKIAGALAEDFGHDFYKFLKSRILPYGKRYIKKLGGHNSSTNIGLVIILPGERQLQFYFPLRLTANEYRRAFKELKPIINKKFPTKTSWQATAQFLYDEKAGRWIQF